MNKIWITFPLLHISKVFVLISLIFILPLTGCSNDDDDKSTDSKSQPGSGQTDLITQPATFDSVDDAAFTVLRSLTDLTQYDENKVVNEDDNSVSGVETLPDNWATKTFTCDEGFVLDTSKLKVRSIPVNNLDDALEFFSGVIGEPVSEASLTNGTYKWSYSGLGSLKFTKVTGTENLFATVDVALDVMPDLTQLRFISNDSPELTSTNSYSGRPYFHAGDVIRRNKDNTYWICVRPSGGPYKKDKSYWIALDAFDNKSTGKNAGKTTIKSETKKYTIWHNVSKDDYAYQECIQTWVYAKNLMSLKTAKAAYHTFGLLVDSNAWNLSGCERAQMAYTGLKDRGIDLIGLHLNADDKGKMSDDFQNLKSAMFAFAYGSPKKDANRNLKVIIETTHGFDEDIYKTVGQVNYVQPFISCDGYVENGKFKELISTVNTVQNFQYTNKAVSFLLSLTDSFDVVFSRMNGSTFETCFPLTEGDTNDEKAKKFLYDFNNFLHRLENCDDTNAPGPVKFIKHQPVYARYYPTYLDRHVIISPELVIKDNNGKADQADPPSPVKEKDYTEIYWQGYTFYFDYWSTFDNCERYVDAKKVDWKKEND